MKGIVRGLGVVLTLLAVSARAELITVKVKGMVCSFCTQGLLAVAQKNAKVKIARVSLEDRTLTIAPRDTQQISDDELKQIVADAGFAVSDIQRMP